MYRLYAASTPLVRKSAAAALFQPVLESPCISSEQIAAEKAKACFKRACQLPVSVQRYREYPFDTIIYSNREMTDGCANGAWTDEA